MAVYESREVHTVTYEWVVPNPIDQVELEKAQHAANQFWSAKYEGQRQYSDSIMIRADEDEIIFYFKDFVTATDPHPVPSS